jgi:hypothetical protein
MALAAGGAAGGIFVGVVAPRVFRAFWEFPLGLWACGLLYFVALLRDKASPFHAGPVLPSAAGLVAILLSSPAVFAGGRGRVIGVGAAVVAMVLVALARKAVPAGTLVRFCAAAAWALLAFDLMGQALASVMHAQSVTRNFYGVLRVDERETERSGESYFALKHGQITHGVQYRAPARQREPTAYFGPQSGIGRVIRALRERAAGRPLRVGVVGLGVGTLAAYGEKGDDLRFYEINPSVIDVAGVRGGFFRYLADTPAAVAMVPGDARLSLEREAARGEPAFDLLILDAFNSDAVPVHLLTREALDVYLRRVRGADGVVAFNLTNRFLELRPVALALARDRGLAWASFFTTTPSGELEFPSLWAVLTRDEGLLSAALLRDAAERGVEIASRPPWTDDYSDLLRSLRWSARLPAPGQERETQQRAR